ncbi:hypothetical protein SUNI508_06881 [Seiridium unicorne]|uniref:Uncharacterized protein n=1 Tax=Seiridium unicorne TaxID=138068 RepID=A0ABR2UYW7_9PEZI
MTQLSHLRPGKADLLLNHHPLKPYLVNIGLVVSHGGTDWENVDLDISILVLITSVRHIDPALLERGRGSLNHLVSVPFGQSGSGGAGGGTSRSTSGGTSGGSSGREKIGANPRSAGHWEDLSTFELKAILVDNGVDLARAIFARYARLSDLSEPGRDPFKAVGTHHEPAQSPDVLLFSGGTGGPARYRDRQFRWGAAVGEDWNGRLLYA